ncbi:hypothetical protein H4W34_006900 [Actinomadura algeriensis]|uniref:Mutator family transposase n=1 Tax=Actinomadura algeriensis TaxID=1679523 RepID=A0ABR9K2M4_9ACTN|nr:hypothetical protein [Actinomadura algeriensis]
MAADNSVNPAEWIAEQIGACEPDVLRSMVKTMAEALMSAEADAVCGAGYGQRSDERVNRRNGYRSRDWDTRAGTVELAIPKLRSGSYFPEWLLERRRRAEQALVSVVATSYLLGVSTRRVDKLVEQMGINGISKSQVSEMSKVLDAQVQAFRNRPLEAGPYAFVWVDALDPEGPRGRPDRQCARAGGHRCQRRRAPRDPRCRGDLGRGRRRMAGVPARARRAGAVGCPAGDL